MGNCHCVKSSPEEKDLYYGPVHIFFGSKYGNAKDFANILAEEAHANGFEPAKVIDLIDFTPELLKTIDLAIFTVSTTGEGDPTPNAEFYNEWQIDPSHGPETLKNLKFTVFGLGDKSYQTYNAMGKRTNENLARLGARR